MIMMATEVHQTVTGDVSPVTYATSILAAGATLYVLLSAARSRYRETIGRRSDRYGRLARLGTGAQLSFFASVLGEPPAMQRTVAKDDYLEPVTPGDPDFDPDQAGEVQERVVAKRFVESTFIDRDYYVQTVGDALEAEREGLESAYGRSLSFEELPDRRASRVAEYFDDADVSEVSRHDEFIGLVFRCWRSPSEGSPGG